jgi:hypothetical protein
MCARSSPLIRKGREWVGRTAPGQIRSKGPALGGFSVEFGENLVSRIAVTQLWS